MADWIVVVVGVALLVLVWRGCRDIAQAQRQVERAVLALVVAPPVREVEAPRAVVAPPKPPAPGKVTIRFMDKNERECRAEQTIEGKARRPTMALGGARYTASYEDTQGRWVYRQVDGN